MKLNFVKYHGAGNDFVICDMRENYVELTNEQIAFLCHRRFGIGADGYMTIAKCEDADFYMRYYNSDGAESTMCGNGGRCIAHFAHSLKIGDGNSLVFNAIDGLHRAHINDDLVKLQMIDTALPQVCDNGFFINTGSPHYVEIVDNVDELDLNAIAKPIRIKYNCNVNFVQVIDGGIKIRTFERGVEDETYACGTGATACAIVTSCEKVVVKGGVLSVSYIVGKEGVVDLFLTGPAVKVFKGEVEI